MYQIKCNKSTRHPSQHLVVSTSYLTAPDLHDARVHHRTFERVQARAFRVTRGLVSRYSEIDCTSLSKFWDWIYSRCHKKLGTWLWCDDLTAHLVYLNILGELQSGRLTYRRSVLSPKVAFMHCDTGQGRLTFLDRSNWWRCPAEQFRGGQSMLDALSERVASLCKWVCVNDLGCLRVTAAGQSLAAYRHRLGPRRVFTRLARRGKNTGLPVSECRLWPRRHDNADALHLERSAYFGGPTHCYYIGRVTEPVYVLDVRSIYPYVMQRFAYSCELLEVQNEASINEIRARSQVEGYVASAQIRTDQNILPCRSPSGTYYVTGEGRFNLCGPEFSRELASGTVEHIYSVAWYRRNNLFGDFVGHFYDARLRAESEGKVIEADLAKLILNALPAKFGQLTGEWRDDIAEIAEQPWGYWHSIDLITKRAKLCRGIAGGVQTREKQVESAHSFPVIPAYVCSHARVYMDQLITIARSGGLVWYSAVDSIHCSVGAQQALALAEHIGPELGQLRLKGAFREAEYRGVGDYTLDGQITRSGLPTGAVPLGGDEWSYRDHESAAELIGHGPRDSLQDRELRIKLPHKYKFGKVGADGWVTPFTIGEANVLSSADLF